MRRQAEIGRRGENYAADYLERNGYTIIARNFRVREGEIDLIAQKFDCVAFVEVKTRADDRFAKAREFVTPQKQRRLIAAALAWLAQNPCTLRLRFDVMEIYWPADVALPLAVNHLKNAFTE